MNTIVALFEDLAHVDRAMRALQSENVPSERIEIVTGHAPVDGGREGEHELMMGFAALSLPAFGPVLASGGFMAPMVGSPARRDGLLEDLLAAGLPHDDAEDYVTAIRGGAAVVLVTAAETDVDHIARALAECGPIEVEHPRAHAGQPDRSA
ncbi:MAG TPA: hypothetical protein VG755_01910 [Nannocystaceae bacterium]|nr:hypothetical protein [Nannocystaceae bacterium]